MSFDFYETIGDLAVVLMAVGLAYAWLRAIRNAISAGIKDGLSEWNHPKSEE